MHLEQLFSNKKVLIIGDSILDWYVYGKVTRVSPEAPVPVVLKKQEKLFPGGAANVAQNVVALGGQAFLISVVGQDKNAELLEKICLDKKIQTYFFPDPRPTTTKTRIIGNNHQITRIDEEEISPITEQLSETIFLLFKKLICSVDCVVLQDYGKGLLLPSLCQRIISLCSEKKKTVLVDPKERDISKFFGADVIKPNLSELKYIAGIPVEKELTKEEIQNCALQLMDKFSIKMSLITLSEKGMLLITKNETLHQEGIKIEVSDVSGAGDTVSSTFSLCLAANLSLGDSVKISNIAGSIVCQFSGAVPIQAAQLINYLQRVKPLLQLSDGTPVLV